MGDNWLTTGDCSDCRRKNYCKKACTAHKRRKHALITNMALSAMVGMTSEIINTISDDMIRDAMDGRK